MIRMELEPAIPVFERVKMVHALDRVVTVVSQMNITKGKFKPFLLSIYSVRRDVSYP
jgi:hypothetical protein